MQRAARLAAAMLILTSCAGLSLRAIADPRGNVVSELPPHDAADRAAPEVTSANLLASERFWPYLVGLTRDLKEGEATLPAGSTGVLVRVDADGRARIDFGRDGIHSIAIGATDLVERANRVRMGELEKLAPNFVLAIGPRLLDPSGAELRALGFEQAVTKKYFVCIFADPTKTSFDRLAKRASQIEGEAVGIVLFPLGTHGDTAVVEALQKRRWPVPFVYDHLSESYARSLVDGESWPAVLLQTAEGRVLVGPGAPSELLPRIEAEIRSSEAEATARRGEEVGAGPP